MSQDPNTNHRPDSEQPYDTLPPDYYTSPEFYNAPPPPDPYSAPPALDPYSMSASSYNGYEGVPPATGYEVPQPEYSYEVPSTPLPLAEAIRQLPRQYIRVITQPSAQTFTAELGKAAWNIVWVQLIGYAIIATLLALLYTLINPVSLSDVGNASTLPPAMREIIEWSSNSGMLVLIPLTFFINQGIIYLIARAFNGGGTFVRQSYAALLIQVPLGIVSWLLSMIPILGFLVSVGAAIYQIVLSVFSVMAVHRLSGGKATAVVLLPIAIIFLLVCALVFAVAAIIGISELR